MADQQKPMVNLTIDGIAISVPKGTTVYAAAQQLGIDIPVFCYLDRMPPFGACRMCLVEVEKSPKLQTSCTLEATEGMIVKTQSQIALEGREGVLEYLLINHPLDCPVCDKGGECPLQDHTMKWGPGKSRFYEEKRHFKKPYPLGPVLMLDRERCITCARCTRFADLISGDHALEFIDRGYKTEVGTPGGGPAESKFIGNTIKICPVGALTSRPYRFHARPWDNKPTDSTCTLCPVGCSLTLDERDGGIMRTLSRENLDVNDIWLCDKGWFGYEFANAKDRLHTPLLRRNGKFEEASWDEALNHVAEKMVRAKPNGRLAGLGGNPLTVEENYLFQQLLRKGGGVDHVDSRVGMPIPEKNNEVMAPAMEISIGECEQLSYAVLMGIDLTEEFPLIWLRLKQAINHGAKVIFMGHFATEIAPHLSQNILHAPGKELEALRQHLPEIAGLVGEGKKGAIFVGRQYLATQQRGAILSELIKFREGKVNLSLNILEGKENSVGARYAGMHPGKNGMNTIQVLENAAKSGWDFLYVAGADLKSKCPSNLWKQVRDKLEFLVVQDLFLTETAKDADVVLPALCFMEKSGSFINIEGRVQKLKPGKAIPENVHSDGRIFEWVAEKMNLSLLLDEDFLERLVEGKRLQIFEPSRASSKELPEFPHESNPELLRATFSPALFDRGVRMRHNPHLIQLAREPRVKMNRLDGEKRGIQSGDKVRLKMNGAEIEAQVILRDRVSEGTVVLPLGFDQIPVYEFGLNLMNGSGIEISKLV